MTTTQASGRQLVDARCYECWLPRDSFHVSSSPPYGIGPILELPQCGIAAEAQYASDPTRVVAVIHMLGGSSKTDTADALLLRDHRVQLGGRQTVLALEVADSVPLGTARPAIARPAVRRRLVALPLGVRLDLFALWAPLVPARNRNPYTDRLTLGFPPPPVVLRGAFAAVGLEAVRPGAVAGECADRTGPLTGRALLDLSVVHGCDYCPPF